MATKNDYIAQYQRENIKRVVVKVNRKTQQDIADHLEAIENVQGYIINLIREDMTKAK